MNHAHALHALTRALRERAYQDALDDTPAYVERQWNALPKHIRDLPGENWAEFQELPPDDQRMVFEHHVKRGVLLSLDRALQIAEATVPNLELDMTYDD